MGEKNVVLKQETWLSLGKLKVFPERASFDAVIAWLINEQQKKVFWEGKEKRAGCLNE